MPKCLVYLKNKSDKKNQLVKNKMNNELLSFHVEYLRNLMISSFNWTWFWIFLVLFNLSLFNYLFLSSLTYSQCIEMMTLYFSTLTSKFFITVIGTTSGLLGLVFAVEGIYFYNYRESFWEMVAYNQFLKTSPPPRHLVGKNGQYLFEPTKVWRNPMSLFRGAEYTRYKELGCQEILTSFDMDLTSQEYRSFFACESDANLPEHSLMLLAWKDGNPQRRINGAKAALAKNPDYAVAYILLAEEEAKTVPECAEILKIALTAVETSVRKEAHSYQDGNSHHMLRRERDANAHIYIRRRLAMCYRKLGMLKEAVKIFRDLAKLEIQTITTAIPVQENLIEALLEMKAYPDVHALLSRHADGFVTPSASFSYTVALLKVRQVADRFVSETGYVNRDLSSAEFAAIEAIHRAMEYNPHVPKYLLELKPLIFPTEHLVKRGDSEAVSYAFYHLQHWKRIDGALQFLELTCERAFPFISRPLQKLNPHYPFPIDTEFMDKSLLPRHHEISVYPERRVPFFVILTGSLFVFTAAICFFICSYPQQLTTIIQNAMFGISQFEFVYLLNGILFMCLLLVIRTFLL